MKKQLQKIGRYTVVGKLGKGGMGSVYKALSPVTEKIVALKVLDPFEILMDTLGEERLKKIFTSEAVLMARLHNPYIAEVWDFDYDQGGMPFFTMEYYCNNLGSMIGEHYEEEKQSRQVAPEKVLEYGAQILQGLACLHSAGIIHRDIKPFNIMISDLDTVKICDFGLSKIRGETFPGDAIGMRIGSPHYAAPEQIRDPEVADARSDLYSVGVLLYRMLTGELPSMKSIGLSMVNPLFDVNWDEFFARCLGLTPVSRFSTAAEMLYALRHLSVHWENVKEEKCSIVVAKADALPLGKRVIRKKPVRKAGRHARNCFGLDEKSRPLSFHSAHFKQRDHATVLDRTTGLLWQRGGSENLVDRQGADRYIAELNDCKYGGVQSWRLPTINELLTLFPGNESLLYRCGPEYFSLRQDRLWSSDWRSESTAWYANTDLAFVGWQDVNCFYYVRAVSDDEES